MQLTDEKSHSIKVWNIFPSMTCKRDNNSLKPFWFMHKRSNEKIQIWTEFPLTLCWTNNLISK